MRTATRSSMFIESDAAAQADDIACSAEEFGEFCRSYIEAVIRNLKEVRNQLLSEEDDNA